MVRLKIKSTFKTEIMQTIYKYNLEITDKQVVPMPFNSEIISVKNQSGNLCLWAIVETENEVKPTYEIEIFGTGFPMHKDTFREFIDTCVMPDGLVWHVFKRVVG